MGHCSVSGALVSHRLSVTYDPMCGNHQLCREIEGHENLYPIWNVMPHHTGQFPAPDKLLKEMAARDVRAVALHPKTNCWDLLSEASAPLLKALEEHETFTILQRGELEQYRELERFLKRYPRLHVMISDASWREDRYVLPLMASCPNLHLTFNRFQMNLGLEWLVGLGCADRLPYSSHFHRDVHGRPSVLRELCACAGAGEDEDRGGQSETVVERKGSGTAGAEPGRG